jgi:uncharacterized membrane protein
MEEASHVRLGFSAGKCYLVASYVPTDAKEFHTNPRRAILQWAERGLIAPGLVELAMRSAGVLPDAAQWRTFLDRLLLWTGTALLSAGVIFFLAYNWDGLGRVARFGLVESLLAATIVASARLGIDTPAGKASLVAASLLVGALLALFGQTYQTGADTFELFATWAIAIVPWTLVSRLPALWIVLVAIINTAIALWFQAFSGPFGLLFGPERRLLVLFAFNAAALAAWEVAGLRIVWLCERWATRLLGVAGGALATAVALIAIFGRDRGFEVEVLVHPAWVAVVYVVYRRVLPDLFMLAVGVASVVAVVAEFLARLFLEHGAISGAWLLVGLVVITMSALGGMWLRKIATEEAS